jgi:hypothetical protein
MNIMLGNLTADQIEIRAKVIFSKELKDLLNATHQPSASQIGEGEWHCFDIPFTLVCGGMQFAQKVYDHLKTQSADFAEPLQIALAAETDAMLKAREQ